MSDKQKNEEAIFKAAVKLKTSDERMAYVKDVCGDDSGLLARVTSLLKVHSSKNNLLDVLIPDIVATLDSPPISEGPGTVIGRYKLLEQIGEGGFGVVYMTEQTKPISRRVALKIIKLGMDTKQVIARFEAERQALAMMEHPNIAKVLDAGATDTGRPYFVMELVKGIPITEYCDKNNLDTQQRLGLFVEVCKAVQHAHQKGIIHRDIKPSNVMITLHDGSPVPKVIDFGIAKATCQKLTEKTLFTRFAQMIGTPEYMSPEQAEFSGLDIDTRSDIYSLGVLLYQLLTGVTPFDVDKLREAGYVEMQRIIREEEPDKPSTRLSTMGEALTDVAKHRKVSPDLLQKLVRGDLDWIVMKSLEKDRSRRYTAVSELAADIERHLNSEPVQAGAPTVSYKLRKFVNRNQVAVVAGSLVAAALLVVAVVSAMYAVEAEKAKQEISGLLAGSHVDRAQALCEQGEVGRGMLWLADSLKIAPEGSNDLDRAVRTSLAAWHGRLHSLRAAVQHPDQINAVTFSSDGSRILAARRDGTAQLCDAATGQPIGRPLRHGSEVTAAAIAPNGMRIATLGVDGSVRLWDAVTLEPVGEPMRHEGKWSPVMVFSPDSLRLITGGADGAVRLWDAGTGKSLGKVFQYEREGRWPVRAAAFCPNGLRVVVTIDSGTHQMFDADRAEPIGPPVKHPDTIAVAISPNGTRFATVGYHSLIRVWEATTGELAFEPIVHGGVISALAFSPDGSRIVSGGNTRMALLWDAATGEAVGAPLRQRNTVSAVAFSPDGTQVVTGNDDGVVRVWDLFQGKHFSRSVRHQDRILGAAFGPEGLRILTETDDMVQIRDAATGEPIGKPFSHSGQINLVAFSPDGSRLVTKGGPMRLWDLATGELVGELFNGWAMNITFNPDGSRILAGGQDSVARLWDAATLKCLGEFRQHRSAVRGVFSPDGSQVLTGSYDGTTQLWDAATLEPIGKPLIHQSEVQDVAFSPDGTKILIGFADGTVRLWDAATLKPIGTPLQHVKIVCAVGFISNGSQLLACSLEKTARLWDTATLKPIGPPLEHDGWCPDGWCPRASFSPDGSQILVADSKGAAQVWDAPPGPLQGECERIICGVQVVTGLELDPTGGINVLDAPTWQQRRRRLEELGGPPELSLPGL
ncbi:MAG: protein kinase domain-containing protein [Planctomycetota bacterium]|jgi:WD40 repeat protein/serine/threonine protein kinase